MDIDVNDDHYDIMTPAPPITKRQQQRQQLNTKLAYLNTTCIVISTLVLIIIAAKTGGSNDNDGNNGNSAGSGTISSSGVLSPASSSTVPTTTQKIPTIRLEGIIPLHLSATSTRTSSFAYFELPMELITNQTKFLYVQSLTQALGSYAIHLDR